MKRIMLVVLTASMLAFVACGEQKVEPKADEPVARTGEVKPEEAKPEEPKPDEAKPAEPKPDEAKPAEAAAAEPVVDDVLTLTIEGGKKPPFKFPHKAHTGFDAVGGKCGVCHHMAGEDKAGIKGCMSEGCHDGKTDGVLIPKDAFHKTCKDGCHKAQLKANKDNEKLKAVKSCKGCHKS